MTVFLYLLGISAWTAPASSSLAPTQIAVSAIEAAACSVARAESLPELPALLAESSTPPKTKMTGEMTPCTLNVVNEDPAKILQILSAQTRTNLVLLSGSDKKLTLNLRDVKLIDMIRHICALTGLRYLKVAETFVLAGQESLKTAYPAEWEAANPTPAPPPPPPVKVQPELITSMITLEHVSSTQIVPILEKIFDKAVLMAAAGPVQVSPSVAATDTTKTTGTATSVLGKDGADPALTTKTLILRGPAEVIHEAEKLIRQMDVVRAQVLIDVTIYDINDSAARDLGATWNFGSTTLNEQGSEHLNFGTFQRTNLSFSAAIKALEKADKAKVLASPNISVLDGERAFILIGDRINFPVLVGYSQANTPIFSKEEERVGIYLQVAASVASNGEITLSLYPQVSSVTGFLEVNGASYPQISTREAQSTLRVKSGETLIMGGLLKNEETKLLEKVPVLGDIPFLGELFRHRKTTRAASQVLISIKPTVLRGDESR